MKLNKEIFAALEAEKSRLEKDAYAVETAEFRKVKFYDEDLEGEANIFVISSV